VIPAPRLRIEWPTVDGVLLAVQPTPREIAERATELAAAYNDPHNSAMMANTIQFTEADVIANYAEMAAAGARSFFLFDGASFVGDADLRNIADGRAELAILIAARASQGRGLGTRFATLLHVVAFRELGVERVYVTILPENTASRRMFEKIGHAVDTSPEARALTDDARDVSMSIRRSEFERTHAGPMREVRIGESVDG
jgi:RimJ/RimL family protein N-acetyltransferase